MTLKPNDAVGLIKETLWPAFRKEKKNLDKIDRWYRWDHDKPHAPRQATREYTQLMASAQTPWLGLVVTSVAQGMYVSGYRRSDEQDNAEAWRWWQANEMDGRQVALHRAMLAYGHSYTSVLPGRSAFGERMPVIKGHSPRRMITFYREPEHDDFPAFALRADPAKVDGSKGWALKLYDDNDVYYLNASASGDEITWIESRSHGVGVCPVVRYANQLDLEGRTPGEVEPFIPVAARIDQTTYDRIIVQRFSSWVVRTIAGMPKPDTEAEAAAKRLELMVDGILAAVNPETKFGSLPATPLDGFIAAADADIRILASVSQTPAYEMLGQMANLSAEALAAARASLTAKIGERQRPTGTSHGQTLRLAAHVMGDKDGANDVTAKVKWADTSIRSIAQAADALGKFAQMLGVPIESLWEQIPGWEQQDVDRAKALIEKGGPLVDLGKLIAGSSQQTPEEPAA